MITNDEAVELLDYIMNDLENAYDAEEMLSQQTCTTTTILRIFGSELYEELPY
jgi:hypothetical protein